MNAVHVHIAPFYCAKGSKEMARRVFVYITDEQAIAEAREDL